MGHKAAADSSKHSIRTNTSQRIWTATRLPLTAVNSVSKQTLRHVLADKCVTPVHKNMF
jgi:hypothetical protein